MKKKKITVSHTESNMIRKYEYTFDINWGAAHTYMLVSLTVFIPQQCYTNMCKYVMQ